MSWEEIDGFDHYLLKYTYPNEILTHDQILSKLYGEVALG